MGAKLTQLLGGASGPQECSQRIKLVVLQYHKTEGKSLSFMKIDASRVYNSFCQSLSYETRSVVRTNNVHKSRNRNSEV